MTGNEIIDLTDELADEPGSADGETVRISVSENVSKTGDAATGPVSLLVESLMDLPELPFSPVYDSHLTPPKPHLGVTKAKTSNRPMLIWHIGPRAPPVKLKKYELWICPDPYRIWKKIGDIEALAPPMSCTLAGIKSGLGNYFAIRAVDLKGRLGPFSLPCNFIQQS